MQNAICISWTGTILMDKEISFTNKTSNIGMCCHETALVGSKGQGHWGLIHNDRFFTINGEPKSQDLQTSLVLMIERPLLILGQKAKVQGHKNLKYKNGFCTVSYTWTLRLHTLIDVDK